MSVNPTTAQVPPQGETRLRAAPAERRAAERALRHSPQSAQLLGAGATSVDQTVGLRFAGLAHVLPTRAVTNEEVLERLEAGSRPHLGDADMAQLLAATRAALASAGTRVRFHRQPDELAYELCARAGHAALQDAGIAPEQIDLLIYVGVGRGFLEPATANVFQDILGLRNATCFDILDACASWIRALEVAHSFLLSGRYRNVMVLNAEFMGREAHRYELRSLAEFDHWFPGVTIGEAATAVVLTGGDERDDLVASFRSWGAKRELCLLPLPNIADYLGQPAYQDQPHAPLRFMSFGAPLLTFGAAKLVAHFKQLEGLSDYAYDHVFGHAASNSMCEQVGRLCGIDLDRFHFIHQLYGNTVSASIPLAMSLAKEAGLLKTGAKILTMVASAGVSTGIVQFTYRD